MMRDRFPWRLAVARLAAVGALFAVTGALSDSSALAASPPSLRATVCVNTATPQQLIINQSWKNAGPADFAGFFDIVYSFQSGPTTFDTVDRQYLANAGQLTSGSQTDTFNSFVGPNGFVPWNTYSSVSATWVVGGTTTVADTVTQPKHGWRTCK
jgi:hypothetical protein